MPKPFQAEYEGSIPFTRSNVFNGLGVIFSMRLHRSAAVSVILNARSATQPVYGITPAAHCSIEHQPLTGCKPSRKLVNDIQDGNAHGKDFE